MKLNFTIFFCGCHLLLTAQNRQIPANIYGGNNQFGNNNTQNNYIQPKTQPRHLNKYDKSRLDSMIKLNGKKATVNRCLYDDECINYGKEIIAYLESKGVDVAVDGHGTVILNEPKDERFILHGTYIMVCSN